MHWEELRFFVDKDYSDTVRGGGACWHKVRLARLALVSNWPLKGGLLAQKACLDAPDQQKPKNRRGALAKYPWDSARAKFFDLMEYHGPFSIDDDEWNCQASAEKEILDWLGHRRFNPVESTVRKYITKWLAEWRLLDSQKADKNDD
jgi:hypothetical protein